MPRRPAPHRPPVALTVAGSDSGGGAGIQADLKTMEAHGVFATSVVTAVTAQHTRGVESSHVLPTAAIEAQLEAVAADFDLRAAKTGMLATRAVVDLVADFAADFGPPLVVDPVMIAASGDRLLSADAEAAYEDLLANTTLATPNADEAEVLTGVAVEDEASQVAAGRALLDTGVEAALVKGGHVGGDEVVDVLVRDVDGADGDGVTRFSHPRVETEATHGSGCALAAAIASRLARGDDLETAVGGATAFMERAVRYHNDVGRGPGAVHHMAAIRERAARQPLQETVEGLVREFVAADVSPVVPEVGMNVVGASAFAEAPDETAAVEGRIARTMDGVHPNRGVRFGASGHVARYLLAVREHAPERRFACNCRFGDDVEAAMDSLGWTTVELDRDDQPPDVREGEGSTMGWAAEVAFGDRADDGTESAPDAVFDRGAPGKESMVRLTATDAAGLRERVLALADALRG